MANGMSVAATVTTRFELEAVAPFRLDLTVWALRRRPGNAVDRWDGQTYRRAFPTTGGIAGLAVRQVGKSEAATLEVSVTTDGPVDRGQVQVETTAGLRRMLGLEIDLGTFYRRADQDPDLHDLADRFRGLKPPRFPTIFECLTNAIACQQLTLTVGIELLNRLAATYGLRIPGDRLGARSFPDAGDLVDVDPDGLRDLGFSHRKSAALVELAERIERGELCLEDLVPITEDEAIRALRGLRGVGRWSAEYTLLRGLGRLQVFPGDDVGARNNLKRWLGLDRALDYEEVGRVTSRWAPYSGLVYFHLLLDRVDQAGWLDVHGTSNGH
jgi:DNA-3-methyladenine glycosylase II